MKKYLKCRTFGFIVLFVVIISSRLCSQANDKYIIEFTYQLSTSSSIRLFYDCLIYDIAINQNDSIIHQAFIIPRDSIAYEKLEAVYDFLNSQNIEM